MWDAFLVSAVGLQAQKDQLDTIASNLANTNTVAYKRRTVDFSGLLDRSAAPAGASAQNAEATRLTQVRVDLVPGEVRPTGRPLDVAITGPGFIEVNLRDGRTAYSRGGSLQINEDGLLSLASGQVLKADIRIPAGSTAVEVLADGSVRALLKGDDKPTVLGQIELVNFTSSETLAPMGSGLFELRDVNAEPARAWPGEQWANPLSSGALEASNVRMVDEMVHLMLAQRVYELNAKVAQAADEMMGLTNSLRR
ncbi:flagellar hook-basal body complex protein [Aquabacterium sp. A7-Y]|uniref:flagellar hook-basal body protein n=1 Tax=Aquabacterium sp. A7-Y TaxID=1349605 RepID=UPI00223E2AD5|nr:flagellar hook-basal body complex protein [Aquabacterium sp. A7-Y]MCW7540882.1 flagellar hook-basal body complex protein [Aquabacterium sp. A7-Y]